MQNLSQSQLLLLQVCISLLLVDALWDLRYFGELVSYVTSYVEPTETKNKLGLKIRNLFKNCNCAAVQELELSGNLFVHGTWFLQIIRKRKLKIFHLFFYFFSFLKLNEKYLFSSSHVESLMWRLTLKSKKNERMIEWV